MLAFLLPPFTFCTKNVMKTTIFAHIHPKRHFLCYTKMLGSKGLLTLMIHGLLRALRSRNPKTPQIRSFFCEKWLLFGVFAGPKVKNPYASKLAPDFRPFDPGIILLSYVIWREITSKNSPPAAISITGTAGNRHPASFHSGTFFLYGRLNIDALLIWIAGGLMLCQLG